MRRIIITVCLSSLLWLPTGLRVRADEGMWLFSHPPRKSLQDKYGFRLTDQWLERTQKATIRFPSGTGSFVSANGLVVTNHHIGASTLQKLSTKEKNLVHDGFYAATLNDELKCPDLELRVLNSIEDVTKQVQAAVTPGMSDEQALLARRAAIARIAKESEQKTSLRSQVVTLYQGGLYHLYRYKIYTDVRLVFAPEEGIAFFGGDTDNFEYPRWNLDVCFFRVYEDGKPLKRKHYLQWSTQGVKEGDLVFVSGNPGSTNRLETLARLKHRRDITLPYVLRRLHHLEGLLIRFGDQSPEQARIALNDLYRVANSRKAYTGQYHSLLTPSIMREKADGERKLRKEILGKRKDFGNPWQTVAKTQKKLTTFETEYNLFERGNAFYNRYFTIAHHLVRMAEETAKPNDKRFPEYQESALKSLKIRLFSPAPIFPEFEQAKLAGSLAFMCQNLGGEHPLVMKVLAGKSPARRAAELTQGTRLGDVTVRKRLAEGGRQAISQSQDPMIQLARMIDGIARKYRHRHETQIEEPERQAYAKIAKARFDLHGLTIPPDATFTLRLAFGVVKGYELDGKKIPFTTRFRGLYERAKLQKYRGAFNLPESWFKHKDKLNLNTPFNFASTADTIGGNSGSPVLNREGELVGINFDRNRHGLVRNYVYTDYQARHVSVHGLGVLAALRTVYGADRLVRELVGK